MGSGSSLASVLSVKELRKIVASMDAAKLEAQLGPFALIQRPPDEVVQHEALKLGARRTVVHRHDAAADAVWLMLELDHLVVATLPPVGDSGQMVAGRLPDCELVIDDPSVSKRHARLTWDEATRTCTIEDLKSSNGTWVNGAQVKKPTPLEDQWEISFGDARFIFMLTPTLHGRLTAPR